MPISLEKTLPPNHEAAWHMDKEIENFQAEHDLDGKEVAFEHVRVAEDTLDRLKTLAEDGPLDPLTAEFVNDALHDDDPENNVIGAEVGLMEVAAEPDDSSLTREELNVVPDDVVQRAMAELDAAWNATATTVDDFEQPASSSMPEFDDLEDYTPEFDGQVLLHRSNANLNVGDTILPSDQISDEMHKELNGKRHFQSTSSPTGSSGESGHYDAKLAHAGTRDYGKQYGEYLYIVEPIEGDTLKWGENFGVSNGKPKRSMPEALTPVGNFASTDSYTEKQHKEVVSVNGFRVVEKISHEPIYDETVLPWPVSQDARGRHDERATARTSNVAPPIYDAQRSNERPFQVVTESRKRPSKIGAIEYPGTYRANNDRNPAEWRTRFDVQKQVMEHPGQGTLPGMSVSKYGKPDRWAAVEHQPPATENKEYDTPLPGVDSKPDRPQM